MAERGRSRHRPHGGAARDRGSRRDAACQRPAASERSPKASACSSRPARPMSRSTRCATSPIARRASRATPSRRRPRPPARGDAGLRAGQHARSGRGQDGQGRDRARDAGRGDAGAARRLAVFAAAVADWRVGEAGRQKIKKQNGAIPALALLKIPISSATVAHRTRHAAALGDRLCGRDRSADRNAKAKLERKGCDWIVANDVSAETGIMGGDRNRVHLVTSARSGILAAAVEGRGGARPGRPHRRRARREPRHERKSSSRRAAAACRRPAAPLLPERARGRARSDRPRCGRRAGDHRTGPARSDSDRPGDRPAGGHRRTGAAAFGSRVASWGHGAQFARNHRCRLSRRNPGHPGEFWTGSRLRSSAACALHNWFSRLQCKQRFAKLQS